MPNPIATGMIEMVSNGQVQPNSVNGSVGAHQP